jgi:hypothetical protein
VEPPPRLAPTHGIKDYDIVYFHAEDLSESTEKAVQAQVTHLLGANGATVDVTNQARAHVWLASDLAAGDHPPLALVVNDDMA